MQNYAKGQNGSCEKINMHFNGTNVLYFNLMICEYDLNVRINEEKNIFFW